MVRVEQGYAACGAKGVGLLLEGEGGWQGDGGGGGDQALLDSGIHQRHLIP
jgi:hypothetical protein